MSSVKSNPIKTRKKENKSIYLVSEKILTDMAVEKKVDKVEKTKNSKILRTILLSTLFFSGKCFL